MPVTISAKKKLRQDKKRQLTNLRVKRELKLAVKKFKSAPSEKSLPSVYSILDIAQKKKIYHANKVARMKSRLSKLLVKKSVKKPITQTVSKTSPKSSTPKTA